MKIAITGYSGFIGTKLEKLLLRKGDEVVRIHRQLLQKENGTELGELLTGCDAVINLAGATINQRWTATNKSRIMSSRTETTRHLVEAMNKLKKKPRVFISASAVGIYPFDVTADESFPMKGDNFLSLVCSKWEDEARKTDKEIRLALVRFGVVLGREGGALAQILPPFRYYLGAKIGSGKQGFPWIHISDATNAIHYILQTAQIRGVVNITAPEQTTNAQFTNTLADILKRPAFFTIPRFVFKLILGEREIMITRGQQVLPTKLSENGFRFRFTTIKEALRNLIG
jgi:uncharacterized protein (TIGR01777 family)